MVENIEVEDMELWNGRDLGSGWVENKGGLEKLDLSYWSIWGEGDKEREGNGRYGSSVMVVGCGIVKEMKLGEKNELKG